MANSTIANERDVLKPVNRYETSLPEVSGPVYLINAITIGNVTIPAYTMGYAFVSGADGFFIGKKMGNQDPYLYTAVRHQRIWEVAYKTAL